MTQALPETVSSKAHVFGALDSAPMTPAHYLYWLLASGGTLLDGFSVVSLGIALPLFKRDYAIAPAMLGFIGSALVLGAVLGAAVGGMAADRIGRKRAFLADMAILAAGSALCVIAPDPWFILVAASAVRLAFCMTSCHQEGGRSEKAHPAWRDDWCSVDLRGGTSLIAMAARKDPGFVCRYSRRENRAATYANERCSVSEKHQ